MSGILKIENYCEEESKKAITIMKDVESNDIKVVYGSIRIMIQGGQPSQQNPTGNFPINVDFDIPGVMDSKTPIVTAFENFDDAAKAKIEEIKNEAKEAARIVDTNGQPMQPQIPQKQPKVMEFGDK